MLLINDIHKLEYDAHTQYKFNRFWAIFWLINMPLVGILDIAFPKIWVEISVMYLVQSSLWALVATHLGAMSSALSINDTGKVVKDIAENIDDINEDTDNLLEGLVPEVI